VNFTLRALEDDEPTPHRLAQHLADAGNPRPMDELSGRAVRGDTSAQVVMVSGSGLDVPRPGSPSSRSKPPTATPSQSVRSLIKDPCLHHRLERSETLVSYGPRAIVILDKIVRSANMSLTDSPIARIDHPAVSRVQGSPRSAALSPDPPATNCR
jgi:hypothetical protein